MLWAQSALTTAHRSMKARLSAEPSSVRGISRGFHWRMAELFKGPRALPYPLTSAELSAIKCKSKSGDSRLCREDSTESGAVSFGDSVAGVIVRFCKEDRP